MRTFGSRSKHGVLRLTLVGTLLVASSGPWVRAEPVGSESQERLMATAREFLESAESGIWSGPADTFEVAAAAVDPLGRLVARYHRHHLGLPVLGASVKLRVDPDGQVSFSLAPDTVVVPAQLIPAVAEENAWDLVAGAMEVDREGLYGEIELALWHQDGEEALLVWSVRASHPEAGATDLLLDATSGEVLSELPGHTRASVNVQGTGQKRPPRGSDVPVDVELDTLWHDHSNDYFLVDHTRGGTKVLDMKDRVEDRDFYGHTYTQHGSNAWGNGVDWVPGDPTDGPTGQTAAVEALWGAQRTWDTLKNVLNVEGYDGLGAPMILRVHIREEEHETYGDAHWDGDYANFGDGEDPEDGPRTELGTVGHELAHGLWYHWVNDRNQGEARGLNEGHADILAALTQHYTYLADGTGPTVPTHARGNLEHFRKRMVNPWSYTNDGEQGLAAYVDWMEDAEEHTQGTAYGHMFAILSMGMPTVAEAMADPCVEQEYSCLQKPAYELGLNGIGMDEAARLWITATLSYFDDDPTFHEARDAWLWAAEDLHGYSSPEYAAVQNAFYIINVGDPAEDVHAPEIGALPPLVDDDEGSVLVDAFAGDDIGVVMMTASVPGDSERVHAVDHIKTYLAAPKTPGNHSLLVSAWDGSGKRTDELFPFEHASSNRLFLSGFESTFLIENDPMDDSDDEWFSENWRTSSGKMVASENPDGAFLGEGYVAFSGNRWMERDVVIPPGATVLRLGYRYRVRSGMPADAGELQVEILDDQGETLEELATLTPGLDTTQDFSNHYLKHTHTLSEAHPGETIRVRFRAVDAAADLFRIDQVYLVYEAIPVVNLGVDVDEREGTAIFDAQLDGVELPLVDYVSFLVDGDEIFRDYYWPYQRIEASSEFDTNGLVPAEAVAYDHFGDPIASSGIVEFDVDFIIQLLVNGDFEDGESYWTLSGDVGLCHYDPASGEGHPSFLGEGCMSFDGPATLSRPVDVPWNAAWANLSFRLDNETPSMFGVSFEVRIVDQATGLPIATPLDLSGLDANTDVGITHDGYRKYVVDLNPYIGTEISVEFVVGSNGSPLQFFLDNVGAEFSW